MNEQTLRQQIATLIERYRERDACLERGDTEEAKTLQAQADALESYLRKAHCVVADTAEESVFHIYLPQGVMWRYDVYRQEWSVLER